MAGRMMAAHLAETKARSTQAVLMDMHSASQTVGRSAHEWAEQWAVATAARWDELTVSRMVARMAAVTAKYWGYYWDAHLAH
jgi:hypothetical protein